MLRCVTINEPAWQLIEPGERAFYMRSLETGEEAVMIVAPLKLTRRQRWSFKRNRWVGVRDGNRDGHGPRFSDA